MTAGMSRQTEQTVGFVFLGLMIVMLILALSTFHGTPTVLLLVSASVFLLVGLFLLTGTEGRGSSGGQSQQQSVVLSDGQVISQGGVLAVCSGCGKRVPETARFCPGCGDAMGS